MDSGEEDYFRGHYTVEQASTVSFTDMEEGVAPMPYEKEGKYIFCLSSKFCLKLFLRECRWDKNVYHKLDESGSRPYK